MSEVDGVKTVDETRTYHVILTRYSAETRRLVGDRPLQADTLQDARTIGRRFCPLGGEAHVYERPDTGVSVKVDTITTRDRM